MRQIQFSHANLVCFVSKRPDTN